jgi:hypothetical protein
VNKQNFRYWSAENPHVASETTAKWKSDSVVPC